MINCHLDFAESPSIFHLAGVTFYSFDSINFFFPTAYCCSHIFSASCKSINTLVLRIYEIKYEKAKVCCNVIIYQIFQVSINNIPKLFDCVTIVVSVLSVCPCIRSSTLIKITIIFVTTLMRSGCIKMMAYS